MVAQGYQQSGLRSGEPQMYLKAAEKFCSSTRGMTLPKTNRKQKMDLRPSTPLKNEELDKRQKRDLSLAKPTNNSQAIKIECGSKIESNLFIFLCASSSFTCLQGAVCKGLVPSTSNKFLGWNGCTSTSAQGCVQRLLITLNSSWRQSAAVRDAALLVVTWARRGRGAAHALWELCPISAD